MKLYETLIAQLKCENDFVSDNGELKKWVVADKARNYDAELLALLLENEDLKKTFFKDINGTMVFLLEKFLLFIEQKNYLNDSYTAYRNKIGLTIGGRFLNQRNEVELVWPYKDCILEGGQTKEDQKRPEIFFNQTLAQDEITQLLDPKVLTNAKLYGKDGVHTVSTFTRDAELNEKRGLPKDTITDNLVIKGNNLLALHSLKKEFAGKVKLIYIDPPYNTGNDSFGYNDSFNHSTWLTFMKNRLEAARTLLKDDGVIFIECDKNEAAYMKVLCDCVFGFNNYVNDIAVQTSYANGLKVSQKEKTILKMKDSIFVYKKQDTLFKPQYTEKKYWDTHYNMILTKDNNGNFNIQPLKDELIRLQIIEPTETINRQTIEKPLFFKYVCDNKDRICCLNPIHSSGQIKEAAKKSNGKVLVLESSKGNKQYLYNGRQIGFFNQCFHNVNGEEKLSTLLGDIWTDIDFGNTQNEGGVSFPAGKKAEQLIFRILDMSTSEHDIVLDFFGGSGTTAAVAHKMNRQYITCEQIDSQMEMIKTRLQNVINGDQSGISKSVGWNPKNPSLEDSANGRYSRNNFIYLELKKYNQAFVEQIEAANSKEKLLKIWKQMKEKSFIAYNVDIKTQEANMEEFKQLDLAQQKAVLCELLDKNQLYVNVSDMNDSRFETTEEERKVTEAFYSKK